VVKHTPFEAYRQLKVQGKAPKALRWERLRDRHESHHRCVDELTDIVRRHAAREEHVRVVSREDLGPQHVEGVDLLIAVGGDGTVLSSTHYVDSGLRGRVAAPTGPVVLGVNSDPTKPHEAEVRPTAAKTDERRSFGALCYCSTHDMASVLPLILRGDLDHDVQLRHRMAVTVRSTLSETRLPPALNDVLVAHPSPAAVSRFRFERRRRHVTYPSSAAPSGETTVDSSSTLRHLETAEADDDILSFNAWSSGLWIATATGATAAMRSAGGNADVPAHSQDLQYMVREHLVGENEEWEVVRAMSHGVVDPDHHLQIRWNSQHGCVWIDGSHTKHDLELGDEVLLSSHAIPLRLFSHGRR